MYDWQFVSCDKWNEVAAILDRKAEREETIGVALTREATSIGGHFLFYSEGKVEIRLNINRLTLPAGLLCTDFSWYTGKLLFPLAEQHITFE